MGENDPWAVLGIQPTLDEAKIRHAYLRKARENHPDLFREDEARSRLQEERMKTINWAYAQITAGRAAWTPAVKEPPGHHTPPPPRPAPPIPTCPRHRQSASRTCRECGAPVCSRCGGYTLSLCGEHLRIQRIRKARRRALGEWAALASVLGAGKVLAWPVPTLLWAILGYLAVLGVMELRRLHYFGCMAWLFVPYSLVLAGVYSLYEGLSLWNRHSVRGPD